MVEIKRFLIFFFLFVWLVWSGFEVLFCLVLFDKIGFSRL